MKKYIAFLLCLIMILSLFSCGKENISQDTNKIKMKLQKTSQIMFQIIPKVQIMTPYWKYIVLL